jgi:beta-exotoxin I transport system ATP-binding protein
MNAIELDRLTKRYGAARGIEDVTLTVRAGEVFGFLGPNGAGKTTTIRTLLNLLHPTSGTARVFGLDSRREADAIHARLGNLPGDFAYDPRMTGRELLVFLAGLRGRRGIGRGEALARRFEADLDRPLGELSRGNRQKVGLVQAAFHEPQLLVLDEPTAGLDPLMQEEFLAFVAEEREHGRTILLSSHDLDEVERVCDRVGIIEFAEPVDPAEFTRLPGVSGLERTNGRISFRAEGDLDAVVKTAARHTVSDIELSHPSLEEVFLTYYGEASCSPR